MSKLIPLSRWWQRPNSGLVALAANGVVTVSQFESKVAAWVSQLETQPGERFAVFHHDAADFLAIVCALWQLSRTACIPSDALPATIEKIKQNVDGFVGQFDLPQVVNLQTNVIAKTAVAWEPIPAQHVAIEVYTSGTTGEPKSIQKTMQMLEEELNGLDALMPAVIPDKVLATVSHHHLYGMTFRLFRPFSYGIPFTTFICEYLEGVIAQAQEAGSFSLVSSPAHLSRFNQYLDWTGIKDQCIEVLSSAAPLNRADSLLVSQHLDAPIKEIYGSSETGAMAWRTQQTSAEEALWQPLTHLTLQANAAGTLCVMQHASGEGVELADEVKFRADGLFSLHGRVDDIAKVEGKRISMVELAQVLIQSPLVQDAKGLILSNKRVEVAAVIVLNALGVEQMQLGGRKLIIKQLKAQLSDFFEAVTIPRRWRFVAELPYNSQGKITKKSLSALFMQEMPKFPEIVSIKQVDETIVLKCFLPKTLIYFDGHFEQQAILPGVVQTHWAVHYGKQYFDLTDVRFKHIENLKFKQVILPEEVVDLTLSYDAVSQKLVFNFQSSRGVYASGRICFA